LTIDISSNQHVMQYTNMKQLNHKQTQKDVATVCLKYKEL